jgi:CubicO group peptidase (beta-lactamase class C family)
LAARTKLKNVELEISYALGKLGGRMRPAKQKRTLGFRSAAVLIGSLCLAVLSIRAEVPQVNDKKTGLEVVAPEDVGWSSKKLEEAKAFAEKINSAAVMVLYDGKVFISWGNVATKYPIHSIRKPLLSALYGIFWGRGKINLDATLEELNIDDIPPSLTIEEKKATVSDLLKSRSGVYHEAAAESRDMIGARPPRGSHPHDTFYYYNNWDFNALGTIFEQVTGAKIFEAFKKEIADPIGMEDFSPDDCRYSYEEKKSKHPAYNFRLTARDMARFGLLYLRKGNWNGRQIIPAEWIEKSTKAYSMVSEELGVGYGYMWNVVLPGLGFSNIGFDGKGAFYHTGVGIHTLAVLPDHKLVYIYRYDTDGEYQDPGEATIQLVSMIMNSRLSK